MPTTLYGMPSPALASKSGWRPTFRPIAEIIADESLATGSESTRSFHWFEVGKIWQWLRGRMATGLAVGLGVGFGVGLAVGAVVGTPAGRGVGADLAPGALVAAGPVGGRLPSELSGGLEAKVPGARLATITRSEGAVGLGPRANGAQAAIRATTSAAPIAIDRRLRFTPRGYPGIARREHI